MVELIIVLLFILYFGVFLASGEINKENLKDTIEEPPVKEHALLSDGKNIRTALG
jgi:hypothetical protein